MRASKPAETRHRVMSGALVGSGKARETFLDETRAHRENEMKVPVKLRCVQEPTSQSQHPSDRPGSGTQGTVGNHLNLILVLKLRLPSRGNT